MKGFQKMFPIISAFGVLSAFLGLTFTVSGQTENSSNIIPCTGVDCDICSVFQLISNIVSFATFKIGVPLGGLILAYGGIKMIISGGNESARKEGVNAIKAAVYGLIITFAAWLIVNTVLGALASNDWKNSWYKFEGCENKK